MSHKIGSNIPDFSQSSLVDKVGVEERVSRFQKRSIKNESKMQGLRMALNMIDLTTLEGKDTPGKVRQMCYKAQHRPKNGRQWNLMDKGQVRKLTAFCAPLGESSVEVPPVPDFVEEVAYLVGDSGICAHFRSILTSSYQEATAMFHRDVNKWLTDKECLSSKLVQTLIDQKSK